MNKLPILFLATLGFLAPVLGVNLAKAQVVTINSGATLTINGGILDVNCLDILIKDGGSLLLQSGMIKDKKMLTVEPGGSFTNVAGRVQRCGEHAFYLIRTPGDRRVVLPLLKK